jgi:hypothetical protein
MVLQAYAHKAVSDQSISLTEPIIAAGPALLTPRLSKRFLSSVEAKRRRSSVHPGKSG